LPIQRSPHDRAAKKKMKWQNLTIALAADVAKTRTREFDPDPLVHAVFRLRNDAVMIGRAATEPLPEPIVARLREPLGQISQAAQHFLHACVGGSLIAAF
jgi:hypothetical protein